MSGVTTIMDSIWTLDTARWAHETSDILLQVVPQLLTNDRPVIDLGCGVGAYIEELSKHGFDVIGVEGTPGINQISVHKSIIEADLTDPAFDLNKKGHVISLEVAEHIKPELESIYIDNVLKHLDGVLMLSWAVRGQGGTGHFNERNTDEVIRIFTDRGLQYDNQSTTIIRSLFFTNGVVTQRCPWFAYSFMVFTI
jgi:SAM-dependent methyltransferase